MSSFLIPDEMLSAIRFGDADASESAWHTLRRLCARWVARFGQGLDTSDIVDAAIVENIADLMSPAVASAQASDQLSKSLNRLRASARREMLRHVDQGMLRHVDRSSVDDLRVTVAPQSTAVLTFREISSSLSPYQRSILRLLILGLSVTQMAERLHRAPRQISREIRLIRSALENWSPSKQFPAAVGRSSNEASATLRPPAASMFTLDLVDPSLLKTLQAHPHLLKILDSRLFEKVLAEILARLGYEIELQQGTKDGGVDIFAMKHCGILGPHRYLLQAKRWNAPVGVEPVRELLFLHSHHRMTKSCLATTSRFTRGAWQLANDYRWHLELRDYEKLQEWVYLALRPNDKR